MHGRITIIMLGISAFTIIVYTVFVITAVNKLEQTMMATLVGHEIDEIVSELAEDPGGKLPETASVKVYMQSRAGEKPIPEYLVGLSPDVHNKVRVDNRLYHVAIIELNQDRLYFEFEVTSIENHRNLLLVLLICGGFFATLMFISLGFWVSRKYLKPVGDLAEELNGISPDDREVRIKDKYSGYEIVRIAESFDTFMAKLDEFVEREQSFTAAVSHELRTPVSVIGTSVDLLELKGISEDQRGALERIKSSSTYMGKVIESLLLFVRNTHDSLDDTLPEIRLHEIFETVVKHYEPQAIQKNLSLVLECDADKKVRMSENHVEIILGNLVRNAIANTDNGEIRIQLSDDGFSVMDSGQGIEPAEIDQIIKLYHRKGKGHGVGLYLVTNICAYYGLELDIESKLGEGSKFSVTYPESITESKMLHQSGFIANG